MKKYNLINIINSSNINLISESILKWFNTLSYEEKILQVSYINKAISDISKKGFVPLSLFVNDVDYFFGKNGMYYIINLSALLDFLKDNNLIDNDILLAATLIPR